MFENCQHAQTAGLFLPYCVKFSCHPSGCPRKFALSGKKIPRCWAYCQLSNKPYAHQEAQAVTGRDPRRFGVQVKELLAENGVLTAVITTDGDVLPCGLLIAATGFAGCAEEVCRAFGVEHDKTVRTAEGGFATSVEKVFAAGDMRRGQSLVVWAIAEGRTVAAEVDEYLMGYTPLVRNI